MATSVVFPRVQFFANNGRPLIGGRIHTYVAGSSTRARTYKDAAMAQPNTNPIVLDARGEAAIYLAEGVEYKFVLEDSKGALIMTQEPVYGAIWPNAKDWPSDATLSYKYAMQAEEARDDAYAAADSIGVIHFFDTFSAYAGGIATGAVVEIANDETRYGARTRYKVLPNGSLQYIVTLSSESSIRQALQTVADDAELSAKLGSFPNLSRIYVRETKKLFVKESGVAVPSGGLDGHSINALDYGASPQNTSAVNLAAFLRAKTAAGVAPVYVPKGLWRLTSPFDLGESFYVYGPGTLVYDKAEWRRRGGSAGTLRTSEQYSLFYEPTGNDSDIHVAVNGVEVPWTWFATNVIDVPAAAATTTADTISYYIVGGKHRLGQVPEDVNGYTADAAGGSVMQTAYSPSSVAGGTGYNNTRSGSRAGYFLTTGGSNTYFGARAGSGNTTGGNNCAVGYQAAYRNQGSANTVMGTIAMEWGLDITESVAIGEGALGGALHGFRNTVSGNGALTASSAQNCTVYGYQAHNRIGFNRPANGVQTFGTYAGNYHWGNGSCFFGYAAGRGEVDPVTGTDNNDGSGNSFFGNFSGSKIGSGKNNSAFGDSALLSNKTGDSACAFGYRAAALATTGDISAFGAYALENSTAATRQTAFGAKALNQSDAIDNTAIGAYAFEKLVSGTENSAGGVLCGNNLTSGSGNSLWGSRAGLSLLTGGFNAIFGRRAGVSLTTGGNCAFFGSNSGSFMQDGSANTATSNAAGLGADARVSGSNQVQLGSSGTTTYAYGAVQDRSDARDKADVRDTLLGLSFIKDLRAVDFKWDMRDDYVVTKEDGSAEVLPKDGSKKRNRFHHGLIAQELRTVMERHGVDFGGLQDHAVNGGCDILSIGYTELIGPLIKAVQELSEKVDVLEKKLSAS